MFIPIILGKFFY